MEEKKAPAGRGRNFLQTTTFRWPNPLCVTLCSLKELERTPYLKLSSNNVRPAAAAADLETPQRMRDRGDPIKPSASTSGTHDVIIWRVKCECGGKGGGSDSRLREQKSWWRKTLRRLLTPHLDGPPRLPALPGLPLPQLPPPDQLKQIAEALNSGDLAVHIDLGPSGSVNIRLPPPKPALQQPREWPIPRAGPTTQPQALPPASSQRPPGVKLSELGVEGGGPAAATNSPSAG